MKKIDSLVREAMGRVIVSPELAEARPWDTRYSLDEIRLYAPNLPGCTLNLAWKAACSVCEDIKDAPNVAAVIQHKIAAISYVSAGSYIHADTAISRDERCTVTIAAGKITESNECRLVSGIATNMMFIVMVRGVRRSQDYTSALIRMLELRWDRPRYDSYELNIYKAIRRKASKWKTKVLLLQAEFAVNGWGMFDGYSANLNREHVGRVMFDGFRNACLSHNNGPHGTSYPPECEVDRQCRMLVAKCAGADRGDIEEAAATRRYAKY